MRHRADILYRFKTNKGWRNCFVLLRCKIVNVVGVLVLFIDARRKREKENVAADEFGSREDR